jgi:carbon monoxide dehydrogenase subunit G
MELEHSFTVPVPEDQAWDVLLDVERVAPCMPGATLDSVDGDEIKGKIKVKLGPVSMTYAGTARFTERDRDAGVVTLNASGKETRGAGTASAIVRSELHGEGDQTEVTVHTSLNVTGRPAQFGRGVMADVSAKLIGIFAKNLADMLATGNGAAPEPAAPEPAVSEPAVPEQAVQAAAHSSPATVTATAPASTTPTAAPKPRPAPAPAPATGEDSLNLLQVAGLPVLKRIAVPAGVLLAVLGGVLIWRRRRRK